MKYKLKRIIMDATSAFSTLIVITVVLWVSLMFLLMYTSRRSLK